MSQIVPLCRVSEAPAEGEVCEITTSGRDFCVARVDGELVVMDNECPHRGGPLGQGIIEQGHIICPWHAWAFDMKTGCASHNPNKCVHRYRMSTEGELVVLEVK